jgi:hypothetical protein
MISSTLLSAQRRHQIAFQLSQEYLDDPLGAMGCFDFVLESL